MSKGSGACEGSELTSRAPVTCQQRHKLPTGLLPCYIPLQVKPINDNLKPRLEKVPWSALASLRQLVRLNVMCKCEHEEDCVMYRDGRVCYNVTYESSRWPTQPWWPEMNWASPVTPAGCHMLATASFQHCCCRCFLHQQYLKLF